jgi:homoserine dehydrogenase
MKKIAVLGFGCIGKGVCRLLTEEGSRLGGKLKYICDLRDIPDRPYGDMHIKDFDIVLSDPEVAVVAELTGAMKLFCVCERIAALEVLLAQE